MSTTSLFVELILIGVSAWTWVLFLIITIFDYKWVPINITLSIPFIILMLPLIYVLGIVTDRMADSVFDQLWGNRIRSTWFNSRAEYYSMRSKILFKGERLSDMLEYGRSRLRICRGWTFDLLIMTVIANLFISIRLSNNPVVEYV